MKVYFAQAEGGLTRTQAGDFLIEYLGEVINNKMCADRIKKMLQAAAARDRKLRKSLGKKSPKRCAHTATAPAKSPRKKRKASAEDSDDEHDDDAVMETTGIDYYFLTVTDDVVIDAREKGSIARFVNHSCNPNCEVQKWNVCGEQRCGFFADRDMKAGTEITIDYR